MKDIRISIRLSENEHTKLKLLAVKQKKSIQDIMLEYIKNLIKESKND